MTTTGRTSGSRVLPHREFTAAGEAYLYAAESGGLFRVDGATRAALSAAGARAASPGLVAELERAGLLRPEVAPAGEPRAPVPPLRVRTLVVLLTSACNLACRYCYEDREGCAPPAAAEAAPRDMSPEALRASVAFLLDGAGAAGKVSVTFFGGEPLLRFPLIRRSVPDIRAMARERRKDVSFSITTNGTLVTPAIARFLKENGVSVCISIDGPREIHDRNRPYASGRGSYDDVARGVSHFTEDRNGFPLAARVTLGHGAVGVRRMFDHLRDLGFTEVGFAPASAAAGSAAALLETELDLVLEGFRDLAEGYLADVRERRLPAFSNLTQILAMIHRGDPMPYPCGAGIGMLAVDPGGTFYPCHRLCGVGESLGDPERGIAGEARARFLAGARARRESACDACWAKNFCSGGCYHDAWLRQGDLFSPSTHYCRWIRELFLLGLRTYVRIQKETPTFLDFMFGERGNA